MNEKTFSEELRAWADINLLNCIGVDECMKACPVADPSLTINDLNESTRDGGKVSAESLKFATDCVQCGRCDPVCPTGASRSVMALRLKEKMVDRGSAPDYHSKYFALKGYDKSWVRRKGFSHAMKTKWKFSDRERARLLAKHIDKEDFAKSEYLFYFGCYIFSKEESTVQTLAIAEKLGIDYEVLGGLTTCCGWPSLMAGRTDEAEIYHKRLSEDVKKSDPKYVVTGCAECFSSLRKIKEKYNMAFTPLTTPMWLNMFDDKLGLLKSDEKVTYHDSCHISRKAGLPKPARDLLGKMNDIVEMKRSGAKDTYCCGYWGLGGDPKIIDGIARSRFEEAKETGADTMIVECITCLEQFNGKEKENPGVKVRDIVEFVYSRMNIE